ncbi:hypothetical protein H5410_012860 [Solanum commersonii]|uniref:Uncharacterized protein n=1 Tax=Solanum commersonii TaxID=4109 RepID=A0A9J6ATU6_SOLCO|nr:hypothetical protein H5410_012860 [Solanum commersonii]
MNIGGVFWWKKITLGSPGAPKSLQHLMHRQGFMTLEKDMEKQGTFEGVLFFLDRCLGGLSHPSKPAKEGISVCSRWPLCEENSEKVLPPLRVTSQLWNIFLLLVQSGVALELDAMLDTTEDAKNCSYALFTG